MADDPLDRLAIAAEEVADALADAGATPDPEARTRAEAAVRTYLDQLPAVVGEAEAFEYRAAWETLREAIDRRERLVATIAARGETDEAEVSMLEQLRVETEDALAAFETVEAKLQAAIETARTRPPAN